MNASVKFTPDEEAKLRGAMKNGGIFLKIFTNLSANVEVQASDDNGGWKTINVFDESISSKIIALYNEQDKYKAPLNAGYRMVSLSWFIASYC